MFYKFLHILLGKLKFILNIDLPKIINVPLWIAKPKLSSETSGTL